MCGQFQDRVCCIGSIGIQVFIDSLPLAEMLGLFIGGRYESWRWLANIKPSPGYPKIPKRSGDWNCWGLGAWKDVVEIIRRGPYGGINHPPNLPSHHSPPDLSLLLHQLTSCLPHANKWAGLEKCCTQIDLDQRRNIDVESPREQWTHLNLSSHFRLPDLIFNTLLCV